MDFDGALRELGGFGRYHVCLIIVLYLASIPTSYNTMITVFLSAVRDHWCNVPGIYHLNMTESDIKNLTIPLEERDGISVYSKCKMYNRNYSGLTQNAIMQTLDKQNASVEVTACQYGWVYDTSVYTSTVVSQFDLVCEKRWLQATASSAYMAGFIVGSMILGIASDMFGRRLSFIVSLVLQAALSIAVSFSPNFIIFTILRFLFAGVNIGIFSIIFVIAQELCLPEHRAHVAMAVKYAWPTGHLVSAVMGYAIRDWSMLQLVLSVPSILMLAFCFCVPESVRWLQTKGKQHEADRYIQQIAKWNRKALLHKVTVPRQWKEKTYYVWDLCRTRRTRTRLILICIVWFAVSLVYYGLILNCPNMGGNIFVNFAIMAVVDIPGKILLQIGFTRFGRRWAQCVTLVLPGVALLCTIAVPQGMIWPRVALAMFGKFCIGPAFDVAYVFGSDLFPTVVRNMGMGVASVAARFGGIAAPYIAQLSDAGGYIPFVIFGAIAVFGGLLSLALPETKGRKLPETLEDGESFEKVPKNYKCIAQNGEEKNMNNFEIEEKDVSTSTCI